jgi:hypothetical protein
MDPFIPEHTPRSKEAKKLSKIAKAKPKRLIEQEKPGSKYEKYVPPPEPPRRR